MLPFLITFLTAIIISCVAAYFSIIGLGVLFAAAFIPVVIMGAALEVGKLVAASWLHFNWHDKTVSLLHKSYLMISVILLMLITALGIYGFLAKGHIEHQAPVEYNTAKIETTKNKMERNETRLQRLDKSIAAANPKIKVLTEEIKVIDKHVNKL